MDDIFRPAVTLRRNGYPDRTDNSDLHKSVFHYNTQASQFCYYESMLQKIQPLHHLYEQYYQIVQKLDLSQALEKVDSVLDAGLAIEVIGDFDQSQTNAGIQWTNDPRAVDFHPAIARATKILLDNGHYAAINTKRGGSDVGEKALKAGIHGLIVIGCGGNEEWKDGTSIITDRFQPYKELITEILDDMRGAIAEDLKLKAPWDNKDHTIVIPTEGGPIYLQLKGVCEEFPWGLENNFNLNNVEPGLRKVLVPAMRHRFESSMTRIIRREHSLGLLLHNVWGMASDRKDPGEEGLFSQSFEALVRTSKGDGFNRAHELIAAKAKQDGRQTGLVVTVDDDDAGAPMMDEATKLSLKSRVRRSGKERVTPVIDVLNFWANPGRDKIEVRQSANIIVDGPNGFAEFMHEVGKKVQARRPVS
jgi:hypothetical protein